MADGGSKETKLSLRIFDGSPSVSEKNGCRMVSSMESEVALQFLSLNSSQRWQMVLAKRLYFH